MKKKCKKEKTQQEKMVGKMKQIIERRKKRKKIISVGLFRWATAVRSKCRRYRRNPCNKLTNRQTDTALINCLFIRKRRERKERLYDT